MSTMDESTLSKSLKLSVPAHWNEWYSSLRAHARDVGIWQRIDPNRPDTASDDPFAVVKRPAQTTGEENASDDARERQLDYIEALIQGSTYSFPKEDKAIRKWIRVTVDPAVYENV